MEIEEELKKELEKGITAVVGRAIFVIRTKLPKIEPYIPLKEQITVEVTSKKLSEATIEQVDNLIKFCNKWKRILEISQKQEEEDMRIERESI